MLVKTNSNQTNANDNVADVDSDAMWAELDSLMGVAA